MDYIKLFEEFNNGSDIDKIIIKANEYLSNDKVVKTINKSIKTLPKNMVKKLTNHITENGIDIDKLNYYINKYDIIKRVKNLIDKGYDQNDIIKKLVPVTESVSCVFLSIFLITIVVWISYLLLTFIYSIIAGKDFEDIVGNNQIFLGAIIVVAVVSFFGGAISAFVQPNEPEENTNVSVEKTIVINKDNQQDTLVIRQNEDGSYYVEKSN